MKKKLLQIFTFSMALPFAFVGCETDTSQEMDSAKVAVQFRASNGPVTKSAVQGETRVLLFDNLVNVTTFKVNVGEIEFDFDDAFDDDDKLTAQYGETYSSDDEIELKGPFEVDLVANGVLQVETLFTGLELPQTSFEEIEFEMQKNRNTASSMYQQTIRIEGEIDGTPFIFASDKEFDFEIEFDEPFVPGEDLGVAVDFYVNKLFTYSLSGIDFTQAVPDNDGVIRIYYNEDDEQSVNYLLGKKIWDWMDDIIDSDFADDGDD